MQKCIKCGTELPDGSQFCNVCGEKVNANMTCPNCGIEIHNESQFCHMCGTKVETQSNQTKEVPTPETITPVQQTPVVNNTPKSGKTRNVLFVGAAGLIGIIVVLVIIVLIVGVVGAFTFGMLSASNNGQSSNNGQTSTSYQAPTNSNDVKQSVLSDYNAKVSIANIAMNTLESYTSNTHQFVNLDDYKSWIDGYKRYLDDYQVKASDEIAAGERYKQYLTPGSDDYNTIVNNAATINSNIQSDNDYYNNLLSDYNKKLAKQNAANDFEAKLMTVISTSKDLSTYMNSSGLLSSLSSTWVDGLGEKVTAYANACDQAIYSGQKYQQYLDPNSKEYAQVSQIIQQLTDSENEWTTTYTDYKKGNENLNSLLGLVKYLPLLAA